MEELEHEIIDENLEDLSFEQGFDDSVGEESSTAHESAAQQEETIQEVIAQNPSLSEEQVRELFEHNNQKIYGKFGEVQREVKRLEALAQQSFERLQQAPATAPVEFNAEMFSNMREEFGEDFAAALARDLSKIPLGAQAPSQSITQDQIDLIVSQRMDQLKNDFEVKDVARQHPDWRQVADSDDFQGWKAQLPADVQDRLDNSWDSGFVTAALTAYKSDRDKHQQALQAAQQQQQKATQAKQKKLEAAVMPQSSGRTSDDYEDDFEAGFNSD